MQFLGKWGGLLFIFLIKLLVLLPVSGLKMQRCFAETEFLIFSIVKNGQYSFTRVGSSWHYGMASE